MTVKTQPKAWSSVGRAAIFEMAAVDAPQNPVQVAIESPLQPGKPLGLKTLYPADDRSLSINVAPYLRTLLSPAPLAEVSGPIVAPFRTAPVRVAVTTKGSSTPYNSPYVSLAAGYEDLAVNRMLSAGPSQVVVAPTDRDEIALVTTATVQPEVVFTHNGKTYTDSSMNDISAREMMVMVVDVADCIRRAAAKAAVAHEEVGEFIVRLRLTTSGGDINLDKHYTVDRSGNNRGVRLAWVNRFGAIDYHTFPVVESVRSRGANAGTPAARGEVTRDLLSGPCNDVRAGWLAEIISSHGVWQADGAIHTPLKVADGEVVTSPLQPTYITVSVTRKA